MADEHSVDLERDLAQLEADLKRLEAEYNMFFAGRLPRPPWETRSRVDAMVRRLDRARSASYADRFRFNALQARFTTFVDLWDRGLRAREEGRPGPFAQPRPAAAAPKPSPREDGVVHVTAFRDPGREQEKLQQLYESLASVRREAGQEPIPFDRFAELIRRQVSTLRQRGDEVAFRVAIRDGKAALTAKVLKTDKGE